MTSPVHTLRHPDVGGGNCKTKAMAPTLNGHPKVSWFFIALGFHVLFSPGCAEVKNTTNQYHIVVDNFELRLIATSFSSYADKGPPTPGQLAEKARGSSRKYPYSHLSFSRDIGRIDLLNIRTNIAFDVIEYRRAESFEDWDAFGVWYNAQPYYLPLNPEPFEAFGAKGIKSVNSEITQFGGSKIKRESYYFLSKHGIVLCVQFRVTEYAESIPKKDIKRIAELLDELKLGLSIKIQEP